MKIILKIIPKLPVQPSKKNSKKMAMTLLFVTIFFSMISIFEQSVKDSGFFWLATMWANAVPWSVKISSWYWYHSYLRVKFSIHADKKLTKNSIKKSFFLSLVERISKSFWGKRFIFIHLIHQRRKEGRGASEKNGAVTFGSMTFYWLTLLIRLNE